MKKCISCNIEKSLDYFYNDKRLISGKQAICKECNLYRQKVNRRPEITKIYNEQNYKRLRSNNKEWSKQLKKQRENYKLKGRNKFPNTCIVCSKVFMSVRKDRKFCSAKCISTGENNGRWIGGKQINSQGYILIYSPNHPYKSINNNVLEHRLVMENKIGRFLNPVEQIHHINGIKHDNRIENLILCKNNSEHMKYHCKKGVKGYIKLNS